PADAPVVAQQALGAGQLGAFSKRGAKIGFPGFAIAVKRQLQCSGCDVMTSLEQNPLLIPVEQVARRVLRAAGRVDFVAALAGAGNQQVEGTLATGGGSTQTGAIAVAGTVQTDALA